MRSCIFITFTAFEKNKTLSPSTNDEDKIHREGNFFLNHAENPFKIYNP